MSTALELTARQQPDEQVLFEQIAEGLESRGFVVLPAALPEFLSDSLLAYLASLRGSDFHQAGIGRGREQVRNGFVRRDRIHWIEEGNSHSRPWLDWAQRLRGYLNRRLFLGLFSFESHFSHYLRGDFYRKHVDAFRGKSNRVLSLVTYLNKGWEPGQGGELVIYSPDGNEELLQVQPGFATLVLFLSEEIPHEVRMTERERFAVAGWFRINASVSDDIDPPR